MPFNIKRITDFIPEDREFYFCDSNVWIAVLKNSGSKGTEKHEQSYLDFFDAVIQLHSITDPKLVKKIKHKPKFVLTSMLISEILNAYLRKVSMRLFLGNDFQKYDFKKDYRDIPHTHYADELKKLTTDILAYQEFTILLDDEFKSLNPSRILPCLKAKFDFNDYYYYALFKEKNIPIITHDKDFSFQDIEIITASHTLLKLH